MRIERALQTQITALFAPLNNEAAVNAFPGATSLSKALSEELKAAVPTGPDRVATRNTSHLVVKMFATAAVDMWMRAVHSFLVSASLTNVSPIWASVAGYYSSHYSVRALAHLLGFFQLFSGKQIVCLELRGGRYVCSFNPKRGREHRVYWRLVKKDPHFAGDPFFTENSTLPDKPSDVGHRDHANYADHLPHFPMFRTLDTVALRARIDRISEMEFPAPPIPEVGRYPDLNSVQIVAYHRLVRFRDLLDAILGNENRFWNVHRNPEWTRDFMHFQLTEEGGAFSRFTSE